MATQPVRPGAGGAAAVAAVPQARQLGLHHRIDLDETLAALLADNIITEADVRRVRADVRTASGKLELHPLILVANLKLADVRDPGKPLSLEVLTQWLAGRARLVADGAIRVQTVPLLRRAGAGVIVPGSLAFQSEDIAATARWLHSLP